MFFEHKLLLESEMLYYLREINIENFLAIFYVIYLFY